MIKLNSNKICFILLFTLLGINPSLINYMPALGSTHTDKPKSVDIKDSQQLAKFDSERLSFVFSTEKDVDSAAAMYNQSPADAKFFFGKTYDLQTYKGIAKDDAVNNEKYLNSKTVIENQPFVWSIFSKADGKNGVKKDDFVGIITAEITPSNFFKLPMDYRPDLAKRGYINMARFFTTASQKQGFGTEACKAFVDHIFKNTTADVIMSYSLKDNINSQTAAQNCGFTKIGAFKDIEGTEKVLLTKERG